jgi:hypothetical protein
LVEKHDVATLCELRATGLHIQNLSDSRLQAA